MSNVKHSIVAHVAKKTLLSDKITYLVLAPLLGALLFFVFYYFYIKDSADTWTKFGFILLDSLVTGFVASQIARAASGYWHVEPSVKFYLANFLMSFFYAVFVYFGGIYIFAFNHNWAANLLTVVMVRYLIHLTAEYVAWKTTQKFAKTITG